MRITLFGPAGEVVLDLKGAMMADVERVSIEEGDHAIDARRYHFPDEKSTGLLYAIANAMPDVAAVHVLWGGQSLCKRGQPKQWPPEHTWIEIKTVLLQPGIITCKECKAEGERIVRESKDLLTLEQFVEAFGVSPR